MLGKLIKHEIRHTFRSISMIYIIVAVIAGVMLLSSIAGINAIKALSTGVLLISGFVMIAITVLSIIRNFYETLYDRQGYLSFTLPVKGSHLLFSKIVVSVLWLVCAMVLMGLIYFLMYLSVTGENGIEALGLLKNIFEENGLSELLPSKGLVAELLILVAVYILVEMLSLIGFIYFSVTVANTRPLQAHPKMYGIMVFLGTYIVVQAISNPIKEHFPLALHVSQNDIAINFTSMLHSESDLFAFGIGDTVLKAIFAIIMLVVTGWIMEHKVNIK